MVCRIVQSGPITVGEAAPPCAVVIFGASGDLTRRLLLPALYNLARAELLSEHFAIVGVARADKSDDDFRAEIGEALGQFATAEVDPAVRDRLVRRLYYLRGSFEDPDTYARLEALLADLDDKLATGGNALFYLATGADYFRPIAEQLGRSGLARETDGRWRRLVVEKPFGRDLASAVALNRALLAVLDERQIFRIDHYLGKETVQNILVFRFGNGLFEPVWNRDHIDHVQITVAETVGVEQRGGYYDTAGALRDMIPNHLFQLLALTCMEPPTCLSADSVRGERVKVLDAIGFAGEHDIVTSAVRGQYGPGTVKGKPVAAYRTEPKVDPQSTTETYAALRLTVDNWRWAGVPFYLRTGKCLPARCSEVAIQFRQAPVSMFRDTAVERTAPNLLVLHIQPDEGISLTFGAKMPGPTVRMAGVEMDFRYRNYFEAPRAVGYETLLYDCMSGDATLFQRADNVEAGWRVVDPILDHWASETPVDFPNYAAGSAGPKAADQLLQRDGKRWRPIA